MKPTSGKSATPTPNMREAFAMAWRLVLVLRPYARRIFRGLALSLFTGVIGLATPLISKMFFDEVYPSRDVGFMHVLVLGVFIIGVSSTLMGALRGYYAQVLSARMSSELSLHFFNHLQHLEARFFDQHRVGEMLSRNGDLQRSVSFLTGLLQTVLISGVFLIFVPPMLLLLSWPLALLSLITLPVTTTIALVSGRATRRLAKRNLELSADAGAFQFEVLSNIRSVKAAAAESEVFQTMKAHTMGIQTSQLRAGALGAGLGVIGSVVRAVGSALFSWVAWTLIIEQKLSLGSFIAFSAYVGYLTGPVGQIAGIFTSFQQVAVSLGRFFEYYDAPVEQDPQISMLPIAPVRRVVKGVIDFNNVTFGYGSDQPVLSNVSFHIEGHGRTCFVGRSGAGKSSIVKMLLRMYNPSNGTISLDGVNISEYPLSDLRRQFGVVWQDSGLFKGSIRENLTLGTPDADTGEIHRALREAQLENFIAGLPDGLETNVAEWGGTLSGGQRQRIAIARALVRRSPVLLLDEATSNLDPETERAFLTSIFEKTENVNLIYVTHRMVSASLADRIFVVEAGTVSGGLSHYEMLNSHKSYREMWLASGPLELRRSDLPQDSFSSTVQH